jgi:hypothetical protein
MSNARAIRYRRLALASSDKANADLLLRLADECDQGILCTAEWRSALPYRPKAEDDRLRFEWEPSKGRKLKGLKPPGMATP